MYSLRHIVMRLLRVQCDLICGPLVLPLHFPSFLEPATFSVFAQISSRIKLNACCDSWLLSAFELHRTRGIKSALRTSAKKFFTDNQPTKHNCIGACCLFWFRTERPDCLCDSDLYIINALAKGCTSVSTCASLSEGLSPRPPGLESKLINRCV